jgi:putative glutamine amidotransferase
MSDKPIIGITVESKHDPSDERSMGNMALNWNYAQAIADAGGVPLIIPPQADASAVVPLIDGWLIPGGLDIDAARFGQQNHEKVELQDPRRYASEEAIYTHARPEMPILGICYGCQFLNVVRGGTLQQHLPDVLGGAGYHSGGTLDSYRIDAESKLSLESGAHEMRGKSYHHQAVDELGQGLRAVARHEDGTVEAIEATDRPWVIGVQWHPERTLDDAATRRLFEGFVKAAAEFKKSKLAVRA